MFKKLLIKRYEKALINYCKTAKELEKLGVTVDLHIHVEGPNAVLPDVAKANQTGIVYLDDKNGKTTLNGSEVK